MIKLSAEEWTAVRTGKTIYRVRRKRNEDDGTWWVVVKIYKSGNAYYADYIKEAFETKKAAELRASELGENIQGEDHWGK